MILPWAQMEPALQAMFKRLSNLPATAAPDATAGVKAVTGRQSDVKLSSNKQQVDIEFAIVSDVETGQEELRQVYDPAVPYPGDTYVIPPDSLDYDSGDPTKKLGTFTAEINTPHRVVLQVVVSCGFQKTNAYDYATAIRNRCRLPSARDELRDMGLALASISSVQGPIPELDTNFRDVGKYAFELVCNGMAYAVDAPQTTIETAEFSLEVPS